MSAFAQLLKKEGRGVGPSPTFGSPHVLAALMTIGELGSIGRGALAREVGLGDGAVRTVIKRLRAEGFISIKPDGCRLTSKGQTAYEELKSQIPRRVDLARTELTLGEQQVALLVRARAGRVKTGIEQRDASIMAGATGATTYVIKGSRFQTPGSSSDCERDFPGPTWAVLRKELKPAEGDVVIVSGSGSKRTSFIAAMSSALTLIG